MEQPTTQTVQDLFNGRIQFQVPIYQRRYVWNREDNWSILWEDILETVDRYMQEPEKYKEYRHFLGPVVLHQQGSGPGGVDPRLVIDGQQRLTTLQILLSAAVDVAREEEFEAGGELAELIFNKGKAAKGDLRFKVWPARRDREAFKAVVDHDGERPEETDEGIPGAWHFFRQQIVEWLDERSSEDGVERAECLENLRICLDSLLYVVSINLDETDNAQVIFETLNARGTGLGALDLVKNVLFLEAERQNTGGVAALNDEHWEPTFEEDDYWITEVRQGREKRPQADWFLMHWLAMQLERVVRADKLFDTFRREVLRTDAGSQGDLIKTLCADAKTMRDFGEYDPGTPEQLFFSRMDALDTTTMLPIALLLFRSEEVTTERRRRAFGAFESWLVRRAILRMTAKNYNRSLTSILRAIKANLPDGDVAVVRELRASDADTARWPTDDEVRAALLEGDLYDYVRPRARVVMLLEACELQTRDPAKTEAAPVPAGLSIEHALPQSWQENWPVPEEDEAAIENRNAHVHRLGNLTLVTQPLNSALSNAAWAPSDPAQPSKRKELQKLSVLLINQQLVAHDEWNEELIDQRGEELTGKILKTWPAPDADSWPETPAESADEPPAS